MTHKSNIQLCEMTIRKVTQYNSKKIMFISDDLDSERYELFDSGESIELRASIKGNKVGLREGKKVLQFSAAKHLPSVDHSSIVKTRCTVFKIGNTITIPKKTLYGGHSRVDETIFGEKEIAVGKPVDFNTPFGEKLKSNLNLVKNDFLKFPKPYEAWFKNHTYTKIDSGIESIEKTFDLMSATFANAIPFVSRHGDDSVDEYGNVYENKVVGIRASSFSLKDDGSIVNDDGYSIESAVKFTFRLNEVFTHTRQHIDTVVVLYSSDLNQFITGFYIPGSQVAQVFSGTTKKKTTMSLAKVLSIGYEFDSYIPHIGWSKFKEALGSHLRGDSSKWDRYKNGEGLTHMSM